MKKEANEKVDNINFLKGEPFRIVTNQQVLILLDGRLYNKWKWQQEHEKNTALTRM